MNEAELKRRWKESLQKRSGDAPEFDEVWVAAEARYLDERRRFRRLSGTAAALAVLAIVIGLLPENEPSNLQGVEVGDDLLSSTLWTAPSDVLIPRHGIDIYQNIPTLMESTEFEEETLL